MNRCCVDDQRGPDDDGNETNVQEEFEELLRMYIDGLTQKRCVLMLKTTFFSDCGLMDADLRLDAILHVISYRIIRRI